MEGEEAGGLFMTQAALLNFFSKTSMKDERRGRRSESEREQAERRDG